MKSSMFKPAMLSLFLFLGVSIGGATTVTVGPTGTYASPCAAFPHLASGDTVTVDANGGVPYTDTSDCKISSSLTNLTIVGINGRPILDASNATIAKGIWVIDGSNIVISNFEFRNANNSASSTNAAGLRIEDGPSGAGTGGNITVEYCYIHNNDDGILSGNSGPGIGQ
jgi:pectate lyase